MKRYLIIEQEKKVVTAIEGILNTYGDFLSLGHVSGRAEAMGLILKEQPDLVFINIDGLISDPFGFVTETYLYHISTPHFIGLSTTRGLAYEAFNYSFVDYLLVPATELDIRKAVCRYQKRFPETSRLFCLKSYKDYRYIELDDILFLKADNNTTDFHLIGGEVISAFKTLKTFESLLPSQYKRIHKSYIINTDHISRIDHGKSLCSLKKHQTFLPFTKHFKDNIDIIQSKLARLSF